MNGHVNLDHATTWCPPSAENWERFRALKEKVQNSGGGHPAGSFGSLGSKFAAHLRKEKRMQRAYVGKPGWAIW